MQALASAYLVRSPKRGGRTPRKTQRRNCSTNKTGCFAGCMDANRNVASCIGNSALGRTALIPFGPAFGFVQGEKGAQPRSNGGIFLNRDLMISRDVQGPRLSKCRFPELSNPNPKRFRRLLLSEADAMRRSRMGRSHQACRAEAPGEGGALLQRSRPAARPTFKWHVWRWEQRVHDEHPFPPFQ